nr:MAG TPA: hypothetical protein [Bacteriophage sp.]
MYILLEFHIQVVYTITCEVIGHIHLGCVLFM